MNKKLLPITLIGLFIFSFKNIPPDTSLRKETNPITGLFLDVKNNELYGLFSKSVKSENDRPIFKTGETVANDDDIFIIGANNKISNPYLAGNLLTISNIKKTVTAAGTFDICPTIQKIGFKVAGTATGQLDTPKEAGSEIESSNLNIDWVAGFDFNLPKELMQVMRTDFTVPPVDTAMVRYQHSAAFSTAFTEWNSKEKKRAESLAKLKSGTPFKLSSEDTPATFTLGQLNMHWDSNLQSFVHTKNKIVLVNMGKEELHYFITAQVEFNMPANKNDQCRLLLQSPNGHFYFFNYMNGILQTCSNNGAYNHYLINMRDKDKEVELIKGQPYELQMASAYVVKMFKERMGT